MGAKQKMKRINARKLILLFADVFMITVTGITLNFVLSLVDSVEFFYYPPEASKGLLAYLVIVVLTCELGLFLFGSYTVQWRYFNIKDYIRCGIAMTVGFGVGYVVLLVAPSLETADENRVDKVNDLYDFCKANDIPFYAATSSGEEAMELWCKRTGAEYPLYWADDVMLKTMIRANPGVVLVRNGVVAEKWNAADVPVSDDMTVAGFVNGKRVGYVAVMRGLRFWLFFFAIPMGFILFADIISGTVARIASRRKSSKGDDAASDKNRENK